MATKNLWYTPRTPRAFFLFYSPRNTKKERVAKYFEALCSAAAFAVCPFCCYLHCEMRQRRHTVLVLVHSSREQAVVNLKLMNIGLYGGRRIFYPVTRFLKNRNRTDRMPGFTPRFRNRTDRPTGPDFYRSIPVCTRSTLASSRRWPLSHNWRLGSGYSSCTGYTRGTAVCVSALSGVRLSPGADVAVGSAVACRTVGTGCRSTGLTDSHLTHTY